MACVLVTGASGYIGRHLVRSLLDDGVGVRGLSRAPRPAGSAADWRQGDVTRLSDLVAAMQGCDAVVHLACRGLRQSWDDPVEDFAVNAAGTLNVLQAAGIAGVRQVVYTSTAQVYGFAERLPVAEDQPPRPNSPYAASKLCGEVLCTSFADSYGLGVVVLRLFNVYGPPADEGERPSVETVFVRRVAAGLPPVIASHPDEARDFIHVSDVVRAIRLALGTRLAGEVLNVGSGVMTTVRELAALAIELSGERLSPVVEGAEGRPMRMQADTRKARRVLGFESEVPLRVGLAELLALARSERGVAV